MFQKQRSHHMYGLNNIKFNEPKSAHTTLVFNTKFQNFLLFTVIDALYVLLGYFLCNCFILTYRPIILHEINGYSLLQLKQLSRDLTFIRNL